MMGVQEAAIGFLVHVSEGCLPILSAGLLSPFTPRGDHHRKLPLGRVAVLAELCWEILSIAAEKW